MGDSETIAALKKIGDEVGYGHSMHILSALWAISLRDQGFPQEGAFVLTCVPFINEDMQPIAKMELEHYMNWIDEVSE